MTDDERAVWRMTYAAFYGAASAKRHGNDGPVRDWLGHAARCAANQAVRELRAERNRHRVVGEKLPEDPPE